MGNQRWLWVAWGSLAFVAPACNNDEPPDDGMGGDAGSVQSGGSSSETGGKQDGGGPSASGGRSPVGGRESASGGAETTGGKPEGGEGGEGGEPNPPFEWTEEPLPIDCVENAPCVEGRRALSVGGSHACAVTSEGKVFCWGANELGQLGDGSTAAKAAPTEVPGIGDAVAVSAGEQHTCVVHASGKVSCWGSNGGGQLGNGIELTATEDPYLGTTYHSDEFSTVPIQLTGLDDAVQIAAGSYHTCAVSLAGKVWCWGLNKLGEVGNGSRTPQTLPMKVADLGSVLEVQVSYGLSCSRDLGGRISCWGERTRIGNGWHPPESPDPYYYYYGNLDERSQTTPVVVPGLEGILGLSVGASEVCAFSQLGTIFCWGYGYPEPNTGASFSGNLPIVLAEDTPATGMAVGLENVCFVRPDGDVACWNTELDWDGEDEVVVTRELASLHDLSQVASLHNGGTLSCARRRDATIACWGSNDKGQLGDGSFGTVASTIPLPLDLPGTQWTQISSSLGVGCGITTDGEAACWGRNRRGAVGDPAEVTETSAPTVVPGLGIATDITVDFEGGCALAQSGTVSCWGSSDLGRLGPAIDASVVEYSVEPVAIEGLGEVSDITSSAVANCALLSEGTVQCWGLNALGHLATDSEETPQSATPLDIEGPTSVVKVAMSRTHACALELDGTLWCWGDNYYGHLGPAFSGDIVLPTEVPGLGEVVDVAAGERFTCVVFADGTVSCWGQNESGQLGNGVSDSSSTPISVAGVEDAVAIGVGDRHACALLEDGTVTCWGSNTLGQLGNGDEFSPWEFPIESEELILPESVVGVSGASTLAVGGNNSCVIFTSGEAKCWGGNYAGNLGAGLSVGRETPANIVW